MRKIRMAVLVVIIISVARRYTRIPTRRQRCSWCETCVMPADERQNCPFKASAELLRLSVSGVRTGEGDMRDVPNALWENEHRWLNLTPAVGDDEP